MFIYYFFKPFGHSKSLTKFPVYTTCTLEKKILYLILSSLCLTNAFVFCLFWSTFEVLSSFEKKVIWHIVISKNSTSDIRINLCVARRNNLNIIIFALLEEIVWTLLCLHKDWNILTRHFMYFKLITILQLDTIFYYFFIKCKKKSSEND